MSFLSTGNLTEKSKFEDNEVSIVEINSKLETALTAKQESEAKVVTMEEKIKNYESELTMLREKVRDLDSSKPKEFADNNFKSDENSRKFFERVENTVGKGEIARYEQFLLFPQCFQKTWYYRQIKTRAYFRKWLTLL